MTRIAHISDLHFGRHYPDLVGPLLHAVNGSGADLVVLTGDLTQRARTRQFREAADLIAGLAPPLLTIPGNHDTPLFNLFVRLTRPYAPYIRTIGADLEPVAETADCVVQGLNTVNPRVWQQGQVRGSSLARLRRAFSGKRDRLGIAALHHPLETLPDTGKQAMPDATTILRDLARAGTDIVLSGHVHVSHVGPFVAEPRILFVQAGTGLSDRLRTGRNSFNLLDLGPGRVAVTVMAAEDRVFRPDPQSLFEQSATGWRRVAGPPIDAAEKDLRFPGL